MNKGLKALFDSYIDKENYNYSLYNEIEAKLKALEIIKEMLNLKFDDEMQTIYFKIGIYERSWKFTDKDKYELLKEIML